MHAKFAAIITFFNTANLFSYREAPKLLAASMYIALASPAELLITDPQGRKLGKDPITNIVYDEISDANYTQEGAIVTSDVPLDTSQIHKAKTIYIQAPLDGNYDLQVIGTGSGSYSLDTLVYDQNGQSVTTIKGV